jgi:hypothetical protein
VQGASLYYAEQVPFRGKLLEAERNRRKVRNNSDYIVRFFATIGPESHSSPTRALEFESQSSRRGIRNLFLELHAGILAPAAFEPQDEQRPSRILPANT